MEIAEPSELMPSASVETKVDKFDEYKFFVEDTARLSERRQTVTNTYITVNGAIVALITFVLGKDSGFAHLPVVLMIIPLVVAGVIVCYFWYNLLASYRRLIGFRFDQLQKMEDNLPGCQRMYAEEAKEFYRDAPPAKQISISNIEMRLPWSFSLIYLFILLVDIAFGIAILLGLVS